MPHLSTLTKTILCNNITTKFSLFHLLVGISKKYVYGSYIYDQLISFATAGIKGNVLFLLVVSLLKQGYRYH